MALDFTGISNENEFYFEHYLSVLLEQDLKERFSEWYAMEQEERNSSPAGKIRQLAGTWSAHRRILVARQKSEERVTHLESFYDSLLETLGYVRQPREVALKEYEGFILAGEVRRSEKEPLLWIVQAHEKIHKGQDRRDEVDEERDRPLAWPVDYRSFTEFPKDLDGITLEILISTQIFSCDMPPRWLIIISPWQIILADRSKWAEKRILRFDLDEIFSRREESTLKAMAALLNRSSLCPDDDISLLDTIDEKSHKHAFGVSTSLKYALRESIELLGNEAKRYITEVRKEKIYETDLAGPLTRECLRYMYRLLFLLYLEARPELGYLPKRQKILSRDPFWSGYSLENLRDMEMIHLTTSESREGFFLSEGLERLMTLIYEGFPKKERNFDIFQTATSGNIINSFEISPLASHLFDPNRTHLLNKVKFRNHILQRVIRMMSLGETGVGKKKRRGRISYAQLGINQLGAVYEALLSYRGFFAEEDLFEVKKAGEEADELQTGYFVSRDALSQYKDNEKVFEKDSRGRATRKPKCYPRGTFIYRLAGRDREKSASYYTPEVLTNCLVKYALKELLKDKTADEILHLTICEPAMGSAAFLNEAVNQLADAYLLRKQKETGNEIPLEEYAFEKQKVKMYIADNNVFGVDLNPVAVELAEVSLWLNTIYKGAFVPWFGMQLVCGNSLIGARSQVYGREQLVKKAEKPWIGAVPQRVKLSEKRDRDEVYHFLLPDSGMSVYNDRVIKELESENIKKINDWRKEFCREFTDGQIRQLLQLSEKVESLWQRHIELERSMRTRTTDALEVWGQQNSNEKKLPTSTRYKDTIFEQEQLSHRVQASSAYRRLKLAMDYWCALWFWPIDKADLLPSREVYLAEMSVLLVGSVIEMHDEGEQTSLFPDTAPKQMMLDLVNELGVVDVAKLIREGERFTLVDELSRRYRFMHWELEFADIFADRGGFDLTVGNPPWIKVEWNESGVMGDADPQLVVRKLSASKVAELRVKAFEENKGLRAEYLKEYEGASGTQGYLNAVVNYPLLKGVQTNLYKCFLPVGWANASEGGVQAFVHPEGVYDDPKGGKLRREMYQSLRLHFQFQNALILFPIAHREKYSINIYGFSRKVGFASMANLFHPNTVDLSYKSDGKGVCGGIKADNGDWNFTGHLHRIINVGEKELELFAKLYDEPGTPVLEARLPALHARELLSVLEKFAAYPRRLGDLEGEYFSLEMWHETNAQKDHTIRRETRFPKDASEWIVSGPHFYVGNPFYKTPRSICSEKGHYDVLDLTTLPENYLPRTNYVPDCSPEEYERRIPRVPWIEEGETEGKRVTEYYRVIIRKMLSQAGERTLVSTISPKAAAHIHGCVTFGFSDQNANLHSVAFMSSICADFYLKSTGVGNYGNSQFLRQPDISESPFLQHILHRYLGLINVANVFSQLVNSYSDQIIEWTINTSATVIAKGIRPDILRRQALVEIDVLVAMELGLTLDELKNIYRIQFPVLHQNENDTWYDTKGRIVFTCSKGLIGVGLPRKARPADLSDGVSYGIYTPERDEKGIALGWEDIRDMKEGYVTKTFIDDTFPSGPVERTVEYHAPFDRCDREEDYDIAWREFEKRGVGPGNMIHDAMVTQ